LIGALDVALAEQSIVGAIRKSVNTAYQILACKAGAYQNIIEPRCVHISMCSSRGEAQAEDRHAQPVIYEEFSRHNLSLTGDPLLRFKLVQLRNASIGSCYPFIRLHRLGQLAEAALPSANRVEVTLCYQSSMRASGCLRANHQAHAQ